MNGSKKRQKEGKKRHTQTGGDCESRPTCYLLAGHPLPPGWLQHQVEGAMKDFPIYNDIYLIQLTLSVCSCALSGIALSLGADYQGGEVTFAQPPQMDMYQ